MRPETIWKGESALTNSDDPMSSSTKKKMKSESLDPLPESLSHLLVQGLRSRDKDIIRKVLDRGDPTIIKNTVERLPMQYVGRLLEELHICLHFKGDPQHKYIRWLEQLLSTWLSYLIAMSDVKSKLQPLLETLNMRLEVYEKLNRLRGKLKLITSQNERSIERIKKFSENKKPLAEYVESSSEEEADDDDDEIFAGIFGTKQKPESDHEDQVDLDEEEDDDENDEELDDEDDDDDDEIEDEELSSDNDDDL